MQMADNPTAPPPNASGENRAPLDVIVTTSELRRRASRAPDHEAESRALASLLEQVANPSGDVLQKLVEAALDLCGAGSAGISLLQQTEDGPLFRWRAVAGRWSRFVGGTMPRDFSPCGIVLDQDCTLLLSHPERYFPIEDMLPRVSEALLIPFHVADQPVGTVWVLSHDENRRFDQEDERVMISLGKFASTACCLMESQAEARASVVENARLYEEAMAANRARDEFFAALSHELRTPLTSVLGWAALLTRNPDRETTLEAARAITSAASLQAQLIDDLLDISRMMTGKFDTSKTDVDLHDIVDDTVTSVRPAATAKGLSLQWKNAASILLSADGTRLRQVISNLLSNAIKFTPAGGLIEISLEREGPEAVIRVQDSGEGIPPQFLPHVFERYAQLGERRHGGMGLGLAIVKHIVELHGGTVSAESAGVGQGSLFTVRLPINVDLVSG